MSAHSYIYVTIFYFLNYLFFKKKILFFFLKMMLTHHISHEKIFPTALYVHGRSGVKKKKRKSKKIRKAQKTLDQKLESASNRFYLLNLHEKPGRVQKCLHIGPYIYTLNLIKNLRASDVTSMH